MLICFFERDLMALFLLMVQMLPYKPSCTAGEVLLLSADWTGQVEAGEKDRVNKEWLRTEVTFDLSYGQKPNAKMRSLFSAQTNINSSPSEGTSKERKFFGPGNNYIWQRKELLRFPQSDFNIPQPCCWSQQIFTLKNH